MKKLTKKSISMFLAVIMLLSALPLMNVAAEDKYYTEGYLTYKVKNGEAIITSCSSSVSGGFTIPETLGGYSVTGIDYTSFNGCSELTSVTIPKSVTNIAKSNVIFQDCYKLQRIIVDENNKCYASDDNGVLFDKDMKTLIAYPSGNKSETYTMPSTVTEISGYAFYYNVYLKNLNFSENIENIGCYTFQTCFFESVTLPSNLKVIETGAFSDCVELDNVLIPKCTEMIMTGAFEGAYSLRNITFLSDNVDLEGSMLGYDWLDCSDETLELYIQLNKAFFSGEMDTNTWIEKVEELNLDFSSASDANPYLVFKIHADTPNYTAEAYAKEHGIKYELCHFYDKNWTYDWDNYVRTRKCLYCDNIESEQLERNDTGDTEIIAPDQPNGDFDSEEVQEGDERYILVTDALGHHHGHRPGIVKVIDINLVNDKNVNVQPNGTVLVRIPHEWQHEHYKVYRVNDDGTLTDMNAFRMGDCIAFETDHFSVYVIVDVSDTTSDNTNQTTSFVQFINDLVAWFKKMFNDIKEFFRSFGKLS